MEVKIRKNKKSYYWPIIFIPIWTFFLGSTCSWLFSEIPKSQALEQKVINLDSERYQAQKKLDAILQKEEKEINETARQRFEPGVADDLNNFGSCAEINSSDLGEEIKIWALFFEEKKGRKAEIPLDGKWVKLDTVYVRMSGIGMHILYESRNSASEEPYSRIHHTEDYFELEIKPIKKIKVTYDKLLYDLW